MKLWEIRAEIEELTMQALDIETGEIIDDTALDALDALGIDFNEKVDNICCCIKNELAEADAIKAEIDALTKRMNVKRHKAEWLKEYLNRNLAGQNFSSARNCVTYRTSKAVEINIDEFMKNEDADLYLTYKEPAPNKTAIKKALDAGAELKGAQIITRSNMSLK